MMTSHEQRMKLTPLELEEYEGLGLEGVGGLIATHLVDRRTTKQEREEQRREAKEHRAKERRLEAFELRRAAGQGAQRKAQRNAELLELLEERSIRQFRAGLDPISMAHELARRGFKDRCGERPMEWWQIAGELENDPNVDKYGVKKKPTSNWCKTAVAQLRAQKVIEKFPNSKQARKAAAAEQTKAETAAKKAGARLSKMRAVVNVLAAKAEKLMASSKKAKGAKAGPAKLKASAARKAVRAAARKVAELEGAAEASDSEAEAEEAAAEAAAQAAAEEAAILAGDDNPEAVDEDAAQVHWDEAKEEWNPRKRKLVQKTKGSWNNSKEKAVGEGWSSDSD